MDVYLSLFVTSYKQKKVYPNYQENNHNNLNFFHTLNKFKFNYNQTHLILTYNIKSSINNLMQ